MEHKAASSIIALTPRERQVWKALGKGYPNKMIARELGISEATVKFYVKSLMSKLGLKNRLAVALYLHKDTAQRAVTICGTMELDGKRYGLVSLE